MADTKRKELNFDDGRVTYSINGCAEVVFNPTDTAFVERLNNAFELLDKKQEEQKKRINSIGSEKREIFRVARELDAEMREIIDGVFEQPICNAVFKNYNVYALSNGLPVWSVLLLTIMDEVDAGFERSQKQQNPLLKKYTAKYKKYQKKDSSLPSLSN